MKFDDGLLIIEIIIFSFFWGFLFGGAIDEFNTIAFFEPRFTYGLIAISILTGMLIGGLYERWYQRRKSKVDVQVPEVKQL
jgi:hypothetical protein